MVDTQTRNARRVLQGTVTGDRMDKTITVRVERRFKHPKYGKYVKRHKKYHAHDESNEARVGDVVELMATRPLSKSKRWRLVRILERSLLEGDELAPVEIPGQEEAIETTGADPRGAQAIRHADADAEQAGGDA